MTSIDSLRLAARVESERYVGRLRRSAPPGPPSLAAAARIAHSRSRASEIGVDEPAGLQLLEEVGDERHVLDLADGAANP
jgi:hypothetical protein